MYGRISGYETQLAYITRVPIEKRIVQLLLLTNQKAKTVILCFVQVFRPFSLREQTARAVLVPRPILVVAFFLSCFSGEYNSG